MWSAEKIDKGIHSGMAWVRVLYGDGKTQFEETVRSSAPFQGWPDLEVQNRLDSLNGLDPLSVDSIQLGPVGPKPAPKPPNPQTQDQIDQAAFFTDYNQERTDQILKTLSPGLQGRYKTEYGPLR